MKFEILSFSGLTKNALINYCNRPQSCCIKNNNTWTIVISMT